jgi:hypothetical protein
MAKTRDTSADDRDENRPDQSDYTCAAQYCPARATIFDSTSGAPKNGLCRYHHAAPRHVWPQLSAVLNRAQSVEETNAGLAHLGVRITVPMAWEPPQSTGETVPQIIARLRARLAHGIEFPPPSDEWARTLQSRHEAREALLPCQVKGYRAALNIRDAIDEEAAAERAAIQAESHA